MKATLKKSIAEGEVNAIPSKSFLHRILLAAALADEQTEVCGKLDSEDVLATLDCIKQFGATVSETNDGWIITPIWQNRKQNPLLNCRESGSTLRFLIPLTAALNGGTLDGAQGLRARPNTPLLQTLKQHGVEFDSQTLPLKIAGQMQSGTYIIDGSVSSQFVTGLLFALPLLDGDSRIVIEGQAVSVGYINISLQVLRQFGIEIVPQSNGFLVRGKQKFVSPRRVDGEGDWSNAAFFLAAGAIGGNVVVKNLNLHSVQGDRQIIEILKQMGADIATQENSVRIKKSALKAVSVDVENIPDLVPILSVLCANAKGKSVLSNVGRLVIKESDRLANVLKMLEMLGISADCKKNVLSVDGGKPRANAFCGCNDHRMVMSQAIAAIYAEGTSTIDGVQAVKKSYPNFFDDFKKLGADVDVESF